MTTVTPSRASGRIRSGGNHAGVFYPVSAPGPRVAEGRDGVHDRGPAGGVDGDRTLAGVCPLYLIDQLLSIGKVPFGEHDLLRSDADPGGFVVNPGCRHRGHSLGEAAVPVLTGQLVELGPAVVGGRVRHPGQAVGGQTPARR